MTLEWDYGSVASAYDARPPYAGDALAACFDGLPPGTRACDVGAGTGRLTTALAARRFSVVALEPNPAMRARGVANTAAHRLDHARVAWVGACGEALPLAAGSVDLVTFGSSFNVVDRPAALAEAARVLVPGGRLICTWNHRVLDDGLQRRIERRIRSEIPEYRYGARRESQARIIRASGRFVRIRYAEAACVHRVGVEDWMTAWRSHLTLRRQAGARFEAILAAIAAEIASVEDEALDVPYVTRCWLAERA